MFSRQAANRMLKGLQQCHFVDVSDVKIVEAYDGLVDHIEIKFGTYGDCIARLYEPYLSALPHAISVAEEQNRKEADERMQALRATPPAPADRP